MLEISDIWSLALRNDSGLQFMLQVEIDAWHDGTIVAGKGLHLCEVMKFCCSTANYGMEEVKLKNKSRMTSCLHTQLSDWLWGKTSVRTLRYSWLPLMIREMRYETKAASEFAVRKFNSLFLFHCTSLSLI